MEWLQRQVNDCSHIPPSDKKILARDKQVQPSTNFTWPLCPFWEMFHTPKIPCFLAGGATPAKPTAIFSECLAVFKELSSPWQQSVSQPPAAGHTALQSTDPQAQGGLHRYVLPWETLSVSASEQLNTATVHEPFHYTKSWGTYEVVYVSLS